jgi:D-alanine-D-alanine ligase-like ATP-grasp enzyme
LSENVDEECHQMKIFPTTKIILAKAALPDETRRKDAILNPIASGTFLEDGGLEAALEAARLTFVGSDSKASVLLTCKSFAQSKGKSPVG